MYNFGNTLQPYTTYLTYALIWPYTLLIYTGAAVAAAWHCSLSVFHGTVQHSALGSYRSSATRCHSLYTAGILCFILTLS